MVFLKVNNLEGVITGKEILFTVLSCLTHKQIFQICRYDTHIGH